MPRVNQLAQRTPPISLERVSMAASPSELRVTGRRLQARRLKVWARDPNCVDCKRLTDFPHGFHLDHVVALFNGGQDIEENCQVLCIECHDSKTAVDLGQRPRQGRGGSKV